MIGLLVFERVLRVADGRPRPGHPEVVDPRVGDHEAVRRRRTALHRLAPQRSRHVQGDDGGGQRGAELVQ